jgi:gliding motility-associated protein GldC
MAVKHNSKVIFEVGLDENRIPEKIQWSADDAQVSNEPAEAVMISVWNDQTKETLRMDLWTKEMKMFEMQVFFHQTLKSMADVYRRATNDDKMADTMMDFVDYFEEKLELEKKRNGGAN